MTVAWTMVDALKRGGQEPHARRPAPRGAEPRHDRRTRSCSRAPACARRRRTRFPLDTVYLYRYDNRQWVRTCGPVPRSLRNDRQPSPSRRRRDTMRKRTRTADRRARRRSPRSRSRPSATRRVHVAEALGVLRRRATSRGSSPRPRSTTTRRPARRSSSRPGTTLTTTAAPGTKVGTAKAQVSALALGGALLPLAGDIVVAPPGAVPAASQTACIGTVTPQATLTARAHRRPARRSTCPRTSSRRAARRPRSARRSSSFCLAAARPSRGARSARRSARSS